jgi:hypothetical protein
MSSSQLLDVLQPSKSVAIEHAWHRGKYICKEMVVHIIFRPVASLGRRCVIAFA